MKKFFTIFFVTLGVILLLLVAAGISFVIADPFNLKPLLFGSPSARTSTTSTSTAETSTDKNSMLSDSQEKALETFGVDPATLPSSITPEQEACFTAKLGAERVAQIKAGDSPSATEMFTAKSCI